MTDFRSKPLPHDLWGAHAILERFAAKEGVTPEELLRLMDDRRNFHDEHGWSRE